MNIGISIFILQILFEVSCFEGQLNPIKSNNRTILAETIIGKAESEYSKIAESEYTIIGNNRTIPGIRMVTDDGFEYFQQTQVYGKYWSLNDRTGVKDTECNTYYLYTPMDTQTPVPVIMQFHGGGFTRGSATKQINSEIQAYLDSGIAYASMDYRLVGTNYYFGDQSNKQDMEFIHVNSTGHLWLDTDGMKMHDYKVKIGRQEYNTMCSYDAAMGLEHLIKNAKAFNIDVQRIGLTGGSAGGGEINYLTWVYHRFNPSSYHPVSMVYENAQLDYPVQNILDRVWSLWANDIGADKKLSDILDKNDCAMIVGNPFCDKTPIDFLCNKTWDTESQTRICGSKFDQITLQDLIDTQVWPMDTEQDKGIATLWYTSVNMQKYSPKPFYMLIANRRRDVVHNALYSRNYAKFAEMAKINYTVYYTDYKYMTAEDKGTMRFAKGKSMWNYRSNFDWIQQPGVKNVPRVSENEYLLFHCFAMGIKNCGTQSGLTAECKSRIKVDCADSLGVEEKCTNCVHHNSKDLIAHTCPVGHGAAEECISYCVQGMADKAFFLSPKGAINCGSVSSTPSRAQCEEAAASTHSKSPGRTMRVGSGGLCLGGSWGNVPLGCSVQSGGDWSAHFKTQGDPGAGCASQGYQLVCVHSKYFKDT